VLRVAGKLFVCSVLTLLLLLLLLLLLSNHTTTTNKTSYKVLQSYLQYQTAVVRKDFATANALLPSIPVTEYTAVARFLESQGFKEEALAVSRDPDHRCVRTTNAFTTAATAATTTRSTAVFADDSATAASLSHLRLQLVGVLVLLP
jgi:Coatomer WD associated region